MARTLTSLLTLLVCGLTTTNLLAAQATGRKIAVLVGVKQYRGDELSNLKYTENDVQALADVLKRSGYHRVVVMTQRGAVENAEMLPTAKNIRDVLTAQIKGLTAQDSILLGFSGHGVQFKGEKDQYFCPMDARVADANTLVSLSDVYEQLKACPAATKVLFVDACRVNPEPNDVKFAAKVERRAAEVTAPTGGVAALFSCSKGEASFENDELKHGIFFHYVLEGLRGKAVNNKGQVTLESLAAYVKSQVDDFVKAKYGMSIAQTPHLLGDLRGQVTLVAGLLPPALLDDWNAFRLAEARHQGERFLAERSSARLSAWKDAAEAGLAPAQCLVGECHLQGFGVAKDEQAAVEWFRKAALQGDADGQNNLGVCYLNGAGVARDAEEAVRWFQKAAVQNHPEAQYSLGSCFEQGTGATKNVAEAVRWYRKAAEQNYLPAVNQLGFCYQQGIGVAKDAREAVRWFGRAAEQKYPAALLCLGRCYLTGLGVEPNARKAIDCFRDAAEQNYPAAMFVLGDCYQHGVGVPKDQQEALRWYRKAAERGHTQAKKLLAQLAP
jgi:TPR repeat protein